MILHVLPPIWADPAKTDRQNSLDMCQADFQAKVSCFERCYGRPLSYEFTPWDIAGWEP